MTTHYDYPTVTVQFGEMFLQTIIDFIGFDYRNVTATCVGDYQETRINPINNAVVLFNRGGQWSRETVVTIYPSMQEYRKVTDAHAAKMRELTGR